MARREIPPHWKEIMDRRGIPSIRALADRAKVAHVTVLGLIYGTTKVPTYDTLAKVAGALDISMADVNWLAGQPVPQAEIWEPPNEAARMTPRQRTAMEELIRAMVDPGERATPTPPPSNVRRLHPERDELGLAADDHHGKSDGQLFSELFDDAGEEDQT